MPDELLVGAAEVDITPPVGTALAGSTTPRTSVGIDDPLTIKADVDAVTGATLSSESTAQATRKAVSLHHLFFGGGERIAISDEVRRARAEANAAITKAVESGELLTDEQKAELAKKKAAK